MCYLKDTAHQNEGNWSGTAKVNGANQYGTILNVTGFTANTKVALAGDRFTINDRMHELTQDATTNGSGQTTLHFEPEITAPPAHSAVLIHINPYGKFYLKSPKEIPSFSQNKRGVRNVKINFVESLR